jgi:hypothetical protein
VVVVDVADEHPLDELGGGHAHEATDPVELRVSEASHRRGRRGPVLAEEGQRLGLRGVRELDGVLRVE